MSKRKKQKRSTSQVLFWLLSLIMVASMVISLVIVALEPPPHPTPTFEPTFTPRPLPTLTPTSSPTPEPTASEPTVTEATATDVVVGPELPSAMPTLEATATVTDTQTATPTDTPPPPTATPEAAALRFAVCGNSHNYRKIYRRVLEMVTGDEVEFLIHTGDLVRNKGTEAQWQNFAAVMADFPLPFYPVPGNHDALEGKLDGYLAYSGAPAAHYSFDRGTVHFALADSHRGGVTAAELGWLREDLSATAQPVKIVALHHPPFDPDGTDYVMAFGNKKFMNLMAELDVDYVFAGHIHAYARGERDGVEYVITGGAGAVLYVTDHPQAVNHYVRVTVQGEEVTVEMVKL